MSRLLQVLRIAAIAVAFAATAMSIHACGDGFGFGFGGSDPLRGGFPHYDTGPNDWIACDGGIAPRVIAQAWQSVGGYRSVDASAMCPGKTADLVLLVPMCSPSRDAVALRVSDADVVFSSTDPSVVTVYDADHILTRTPGNAIVRAEIAEEPELPFTVVDCGL
jgi:hypothetical protein